MASRTRIVDTTTALALAIGAAAPHAHAQSDDPLFAEAAEAEAENASGIDWIGDVLLRRDQVNGLANREPVDRLRARARFGLRYATDAWEFGAAVEGTQGSDANKDNVRNNDNEKSDGASLDEAYARWLPNEATRVTLGKTALPLATTPLTWDADLRPVGASVVHDFALGEFDRLRVVAGYFAGDHLYGDDSRITALQAAWHLREGAPWSGEVSIAYLEFDELETAAARGLTRTNRRIGTRLVSDYELLDLQLALRANAWRMPFEARLDFVRNLGADDQDEGVRAQAILGTSRAADSWELGLSYQRIQRDAVMAAFNEDDWWFHSFARGFMPWLAYGITDAVSVRLAGFFERRDDQQDDVRRLLLDVRAEW